MSLLKFGIIGSGSIAKKHIHLIKKNTLIHKSVFFFTKRKLKLNLN